MIGAIYVEMIAFTIFGALSFVFYDRKGQRLIRRDFIDDALFFLLSVIFYGKITGFYLSHIGAPPFARMISRQPLWLQSMGVLVIYDFIQYWLHRGFHSGRFWPFHAVHHSAEEMDVLTSFRIHPLNFIPYSGIPTVVLLMAGFTPEAFASVAGFNFFMGCLTHANLNWTFGPFRFVLASPMFHRWHHAIVEGSLSRNYAPNFPVWDLLFGTYYLPVGDTPKAYGAPEVPRHFVGQLAHPFAAQS